MNIDMIIQKCKINEYLTIVNKNCNLFKNSHLPQNAFLIKNIQYFLYIQMTTNINTTAALWNNSYSNTKFCFELAFLIFTIVLWIFQLKHTLSVHNSYIVILIGFILSQLLVDFISGLVHWACDTWGRFETPYVGPTLIRNFRMHHVDPQDITRHGFVQTNASSCYPAPPFIIVGLLLTPGSSAYVQIYLWMINFGVILAIYTNEIHKWSHMVHSKPNPIIRFLQKCRLILSHEHHHIHHMDQFDHNYCIINGWMNPFLQKINFWRRTEKFITMITGIQPRADDNFWRQLKNPTKCQ